MAPIRTLPEKSPDKLEKSLRSDAHELLVGLLREARTAAGLSQVEAARRLGARQSLISDLERGERRIDVIEFIRFCRIYDVQPAALIGKLAASMPAPASARKK